MTHGSNMKVDRCNNLEHLPLAR